MSCEGLQFLRITPAAYVPEPTAEDCLTCRCSPGISCPHTIEQAAEVVVATHRFQQRILFEPRNTWKPGVDGALQPNEALIALSKLRERSANTVRDVMIEIRCVHNSFDPRARLIFQPGCRLDRGQHRLSANIRFAGSCERTENRTGAGRISRVVTGKAQILPKSGNLGLPLEKLVGLLDSLRIFALEQQQRDLKSIDFVVSVRIQTASETRLQPCLLECAEVIEDAHPRDVRQIKRRIERERFGGPFEHNLPIEAAVKRPGRAGDGQVRVGQ